jgi:DNA-binding transcriptional ArsR family regulator
MSRAHPPAEVFRAVSDPTRRTILERLRGTELGAGELAAPFDMTPAAISQHLRVLLDADLVRVRKDGRHRVYRLNALPLQALFDWAAYFEDFWPKKLDALGEYLDQTP